MDHDAYGPGRGTTARMDGDGAGKRPKGRPRLGSPGTEFDCCGFLARLQGGANGSWLGVDERPGWTRRQPARGKMETAGAARSRRLRRLLAVRRTKTTGTAFCRAKVGACLPFGRSGRRMVSVIYMVVAEVSRNRINTIVFVYTPFLSSSPADPLGFARAPAARSLGSRRSRRCAFPEAPFGTRINRPASLAVPWRADAGGAARQPPAARLRAAVFSFPHSCYGCRAP